MPNWFWLISVAIYGGCIGSFLNVVIYRLPEGKSLISPGSRCPSCDHGLAWYDNIPVLGWLWLRGKCRYCKAPISAQYPLIEAFTALIFAGLFIVYYMTSLRWVFSTPGHGFPGTWQIYLVHVVLIAGLIASTLIDAKLFIIPRQIPWFLTAVAVLVLPVVIYLGNPLNISRMPASLQTLGNWIGAPAFLSGLVPRARLMGVWAAMGGSIGLAVSLILLKLKLIPMSFADYEEVYKAHLDKLGDSDDPEAWFHYPHPRREVLKEMLFLLPPIAGIVIGAWLTPRGVYPLQMWQSTLGGVVMGYFFGAGIIWLTRILGTLAFGKEAMGLGDVHLLAAIGAILGAPDTIPIFFIAPFFGLAAALATFGLSAVMKKRFQSIPYGPYLAGATVLFMVLRDSIMDIQALKLILQVLDKLCIA